MICRITFTGDCTSSSPSPICAKTLFSVGLMGSGGPCSSSLTHVCCSVWGPHSPGGLQTSGGCWNQLCSSGARRGHGPEVNLSDGGSAELGRSWKHRGGGGIIWDWGWWDPRPWMLRGPMSEEKFPGVNLACGWFWCCMWCWISHDCLC